MGVPAPQRFYDSPARVFPLPAILIAAISGAVLIPMLFKGIPSGHDLEFHVNSWMEVVHQWHSGVIYPSWASLAHYGFGEARFVFYPPASWLSGALLGTILPWAIVPGVYVWLALTASGCTMFLLARRFLPPGTATFVAAFYAINPYHLVIVYWRSAYAELLASLLLPLLLLALLRAEQDERKVVVPLALIIAAAWLINVPAAVMLNYSLAVLVLCMAFLRRSPRVLLYGAAGVVLGAALAAFYLVPVAHEQKWVNISEVLSPGVRPQDNFLFTLSSDPDHNHFNQLVSVVAVGEIALVCIAVFLSRHWRRKQRLLWWSAIIWAVAATMVMVSFTNIFWEYLPKLRFVQLPWRWLLCLNVAMALFIGLALRRWSARIVFSIGTLVVLMLICVRIQPPWWDSVQDIHEMQDDIAAGRGYDGTDEYVTAGADPYEIKQDAPKIRIQSGRGAVRILEWKPESKAFISEMSEPAKLRLKLFDYPAWHVDINGREVTAEADEITGEMLVPVPAGKNLVRVLFQQPWDRRAGAIVSVTTLGLVLIVSARFRRRAAAA